jgi:hypothetical protein
MSSSLFLSTRETRDKIASSNEGIDETSDDSGPPPPPLPLLLYLPNVGGVGDGNFNVQ